MTARVLPCGTSALLVEVSSLGEVLSLRSALKRAEPPGIVDLVPAAQTLLLVAASPRALPGLRSALDAVLEEWSSSDIGPGQAQTESPLVEFPVTYDGADLDEVARLTGLTPGEVVAAHTGGPWTVGFYGFSPGFAYLTGGDPRLSVPRRNEPRTRVPAGAVGLAGSFSAVYPQASPGGWQIIGRTDLAVWDVDRQPPALLQPGTRVRFTDIGAAGAGRPAAGGVAFPEVERSQQHPTRRGAPADRTPRQGRAALEVIATGPQTLVQDMGRPGLAHIGVGPSGAADRTSFRLGARLLGQSSDCAALEVMLGGLAIRSLGSVEVAVTGAPARATIDGAPIAHAAPVLLRDGQTLALAAPEHGLRTYLSVHGGIDVAAVLGSRATDTLSGIGPSPVVAGDVLPVGIPAGEPNVDVAPVTLPTADTLTLGVFPGPRADWLADLSRLMATRWTVSARSDRIGIRLEGEPLAWHPERQGQELSSEGVVRGGVQVPPGGEPVLFLADHPVTGGYPVVAVLAEADVDRVAQAVPGQPIRFQLSPG